MRMKIGQESLHNSAPGPFRYVDIRLNQYPL